jgi:hypothetical protein
MESERRGPEEYLQELFPARVAEDFTPEEREQIRGLLQSSLGKKIIRTLMVIGDGAGSSWRGVEGMDDLNKLRGRVAGVEFVVQYLAGFLEEPENE